MEKAYRLTDKGRQLVFTELRKALESNDLDRARTLLGVPKKNARGAPYKHRRWARCVSCFKKQQVAVQSKPKGLRMRDQRCACGGRLHPLNWHGFR